MTRLDWLKPIGGTDDLLAMVPGLAREAFWKRKRIIEGKAPGKVGVGRAAVWIGEDVLQATTLHEIARTGAMLSEAWRVWLIVREAMILRQVGGPPCFQAVALACLSSGAVVLREFDECDPDSAGMGHPGAPNVYVVVRVGALINSVESRIRAMQPELAS